MSTLLRNLMLGEPLFQPLCNIDGVVDGGAAGGGVAPGGGDAPAAAAAAAAAAGGAAPPGGVKVPAVADAAAAAAAGGAAKPGDGTIAGGGAKVPDIAVQPKWPDNWREELAGDDKAKLNILTRYDSPAAWAKAQFELRTKVDSGELKGPAKPMPKDATPEQITAWRTEQGLPASPDAYVGALKLPDGIVAGEADKPLLGDFAKAAHDAGMDQRTFDFAANWYFQRQEQVQAEQLKADGAFKNQTLVKLGQEWGGEFAANNNAVTNTLNLLPEDIRHALMTARTTDGRVLGNDPAFNQGILLLGKMINPAAALLPNIGGGGMSNVEGRIAEIETKHLRAPQGSPEWHAYWSGDGGVKLQGEYRQLLEARETMKKRSAA